MVLAGHSLGGLKVAYTQAFAPHSKVVGLALCSPPRLPDEKFWDQQWFQEQLGRARRLADEGRPDELMFVAMPNNPPGLKGVFSAATYLNKYGPEAATTLLRYVDRIAVPTLVLAGTEEAPLLDFARDVDRALGAGVRHRLIVVPGADHLYHGKEPEVAAALRSWFDEL